MIVDVKTSGRIHVLVKTVFMWNSMHGNMPFEWCIGCSQPSIFSYFYSIVEYAEGITRELDASAKLKT